MGLCVIVDTSANASTDSAASNDMKSTNNAFTIPEKSFLTKNAAAENRSRNSQIAGMKRARKMQVNPAGQPWMPFLDTKKKVDHER